MSTTSPVFLSIIIPAHNEEKRLPATLQQVCGFLDRQEYSGEVLVVENGSRDRTYEVARDYAADHPCLCVLREPGRGKGLAVRAGMLAACGQYRFICDADLSMPIEQVNRFLPPQLADVEIAIASRESPGSVRYNEPHYRHLVGRVFNTLVRWMALPGLRDTQAGFKCFRGDIAAELFPLQTIMGWTFDVEVLYIARRRGYRIVEVPIDWYFNADSKVRVWRDSVTMFTDLLAIRRNARRGLYEPPGENY